MTEETVSILIPAYNESRVIGETILAIKNTGKANQIIVINDGSKDDTCSIARASGAEVVDLSQNVGKGGALNHGLKYAKGDIIGLIDADLGKSASELEKLVDPIIENKADMTIGRFPPAKKKGGFGLVTSLAKRGIRWFTGLEVSSPLSGQRVMRRSVIQKIGSFESGFGVEVGLTIDVFRLGFRVKEIPVQMTHTETGRNFAGFLHRGRQFLDVVLVLLEDYLRGDLVADVINFIQPALFSLTRYLIIIIISYVLTAMTFSYLVKLITEAGIKKLNFRGEEIPTSMGLIFVLLLPFITTIGMILSVKSFAMTNSLLFLFITIGMGMMGFLDDQLGNNIKGFRGHLKAFFMEKRLTSGGLKIVFGAIIALTFTVGNALWLKSDSFPWISFINFFLICLATNTINLFDLRPGRAGKVFLVIFILILLFSKYLESYISLFIPIIAILLFYLPFDLRAQVMMGDVGSNLLGSALGVMMVWMLSDLGKIIALIILIGLQVLAEKFSFSELIERFQFLKQLDELGRGKK